MRNKSLIVIILSVMLAVGTLGYFTSETIAYAEAKFEADGFILSTVDEGSIEDTVNAQYYFNEGSKFLSKQDNTISFKTVNGERVSVNKENFIHYNDSSMSTLQKSVLLDTDTLYEDNLAYYSISKNSLIEKRTNGYAFFNGAETITLQNFIWKLSEEQYMVVSDHIKLVVEEGSTQSFDGFIQVLYKDHGIVYLINQDGTYSTVSSYAYLELENGFRIYIGSKNVSDENGIIMNLSQMIVNSGDNVSLNPDEEYVNETIVQPMIQVNAEDGSDGTEGTEGTQGTQGTQGEEGEAGESGENGNNGNNGQNGQNGAQGNQGAAGKTGSSGTGGTDGDSGDIKYLTDIKPEVKVDLDPLSYGVNAQVTYDVHKADYPNMTIETSKSYVSIVESATGNVVWDKNNCFADTEKTTEPVKFNCFTLQQNTNYTFLVWMAYRDNNGNNKFEVVASKYFTTLPIGIELQIKEVGQNTIIADIVKTNPNNIESIAVQCYDKDKKVIKNDLIEGIYGLPSDTDLIIGNTKNINVKDLPVGGSIEIVIPSFYYAGADDLTLERNSVYYLRLENANFGSSDGNTSIVATEGFPYQMVKTLKADGSLGVPDVTISERENSLVITPRDIIDPDGGFMTYTYEIYYRDPYKTPEETLVSERPIYTVEKTVASEIKVPIMEDGNKTQRIVRNGTYFTRIVGKFDNNQETVLLSSGYNPFTVPNSSWPSMEVKYDENFLTASTLQGTVEIRDTDGVINKDRPIKITYRSTSLVGSKVIEGTIETDAEGGFYLHNYGNGPTYSIPFFISGLKSNQTYVVEVSSESITIDGVEDSGIIGTQTFTTKEYAPIMLHTQATNTNADDPNGTHLFTMQLSFTAEDRDKENENTSAYKTNTFRNQFNYIANKLENMGDFSGKALYAVKLELYSISHNDSGENVYTLIGDMTVRREFKNAYTTGTNKVYEFGHAINDIYFIDEDKIWDSSIIIDSTDFIIGDKAKDYAGRDLAVKVTAYDYCNIVDSENNLQDYNNIPVKSNEIKTVQERMSTYILITAADEISPPEDLAVYDVTQKEAISNLASYKSAGTGYKNNHMSNWNNLDNTWAELYGTTVVGFKIGGSNSDGAFCKYAKEARYTIYTVDGEYNRSAEPLYVTDWLSMENGSYPKFTYFFDEHLKRGERFYVKVDYKLKEEAVQKYKTTAINASITDYPAGYTDREIFYPGRDYDGDGRVDGFYRATKQVPAFYFAEKNIEVINNEQRTITGDYYFDYLDPDNTIGKDGDGKILFYIADNSSHANIEVKDNPAYASASDAALRYIISFDGDDNYNRGCNLQVRRKLFDVATEETVNLITNKGIAPNKISNISFLTAEEYASMTDAERYSVDHKCYPGIELTYNGIDFSINKASNNIDFFTVVKAEGKNLTVNDLTGYNLMLKLTAASDTNNGVYTQNIDLTTGNISQVEIGNDDYALFKVSTTIALDQKLTTTTKSGITILDFLGTESFDAETKLTYTNNKYGLDYANQSGKEFIMYLYDTGRHVMNAAGAKIQRFKASGANLLKFEKLRDGNNTVENRWVLINNADLKLTNSYNYNGILNALQIKSNGLNALPHQEKDASLITENLSITGLYAIISASIVPSVDYAKVTINIGPGHNLVQADGAGNNIRVVIKKHGTSEILCEIPYRAETDPEKKDYYTNQVATGLQFKGNTEYDVELQVYKNGVWIDVNKDVSGSDQILTNWPANTGSAHASAGIEKHEKDGHPGEYYYSFTTMEGIHPVLTDSSFVMNARINKSLILGDEQAERKYKSAYLKYTIKDLNWLELESVDKLEVSLTDNTKVEVPRALIETVFKEQFPTLFDAAGNNIDDETKVELSLTTYIGGDYGWAPGSKHKLASKSTDSSPKYHAEVKAYYTNGESNIEEEAMHDYVPTYWSSRDSYMTIKATEQKYQKGTPGVNDGETKVVGTIKIRDLNRVFNIYKNADKFYIKVKLYLEYYGADSTTPPSEYKNQTIEIPYNLSSDLASYEFTFEHVVGNRNYRVEAYIDEDFNNDGDWNNSTGTKYTSSGYREVVDYLPLQGGYLDTRLSTIQFNLPTKTEETGSLTLYGEDLDAVKYIEYTLTRLGADPTTFDPVKFTVNSNNYVPQSAISNRVYILRYINLEPDTEYRIQMSLYGDKRDDDTSPITAGGKEYSVLVSNHIEYTPDSNISVLGAIKRFAKSLIS